MGRPGDPGGQVPYASTRPRDRRGLRRGSLHDGFRGVAARYRPEPRGSWTLAIGDDTSGGRGAASGRSPDATAAGFRRLAAPVDQHKGGGRSRTSTGSRSANPRRSSPLDERRPDPTPWSLRQQLRRPGGAGLQLRGSRRGVRHRRAVLNKMLDAKELLWVETRGPQAGIGNLFDEIKAPSPSGSRARLRPGAPCRGEFATCHQNASTDTRDDIPTCTGGGLRGRGRRNRPAQANGRSRRRTPGPDTSRAGHRSLTDVRWRPFARGSRAYRRGVTAAAARARYCPRRVSDSDGRFPPENAPGLRYTPRPTLESSAT